MRVEAPTGAREQREGFARRPARREHHCHLDAAVGAARTKDKERADYVAPSVSPPFAVDLCLFQGARVGRRHDINRRRSIHKEPSFTAGQSRPPTAPQFSYPLSPYGTKVLSSIPRVGYLPAVPWDAFQGCAPEHTPARTPATGVGDVER